MNKYPAWKYAIIVIAIVVSLIYAAPNLFGEVPAVQVASTRSTLKVDSALDTQLADALKAANIPFTGDERDETAIRFRFADTDMQLKARDAIQAKVGQNEGY